MKEQWVVKTTWEWMARERKRLYGLNMETADVAENKNKNHLNDDEQGSNTKHFVFLRSWSCVRSKDNEKVAQATHSSFISIELSFFFFFYS
jgi:hypothetical protein